MRFLAAGFLRAVFPREPRVAFRLVAFLLAGLALRFFAFRATLSPPLIEWTNDSSAQHPQFQGAALRVLLQRPPTS